MRWNEMKKRKTKRWTEYEKWKMVTLNSNRPKTFAVGQMEKCSHSEANLKCGNIITYRRFSKSKSKSQSKSQMRKSIVESKRTNTQIHKYTKPITARQPTMEKRVTPGWREKKEKKARTHTLSWKRDTLWIQAGDIMRKNLCCSNRFEHESFGFYCCSIYVVANIFIFSNQMCAAVPFK